MPAAAAATLLPDPELTLLCAILCAMYLFSGIEKLFKLRAVAEGLRKRAAAGVPIEVYEVIIAGAAVYLTACTCAVVYASTLRPGDARSGYGAWAAYALVAFTVLATLLYHFPPTGATYYPFISNVTAVGGLLLLAKHFRERGAQRRP